MLQAGGVGTGRAGARGASARRRALRRTRSTRASCSSGWGWPGSSAAPGGRSPAASSDAWPWPSRWSGRPQVAFLDEPSSGVDPVGPSADPRRSSPASATTASPCVLTSHDLDEVERLADHVVILDHGRVLAAGTPASLTTGAGRRGALRRAAGLDVAAPGRGTSARRSRRRATASTSSGRPARPRSSPRSPPGWPSTTSRWPTSAPGGSGSRTCSSGSCADATTRTTRAVRPLAAHLRLELALLAAQRRVAAADARHPGAAAACSSPTSTCCPIDGEPIDFLAPGVLALAVLSTAFVNLAIARGVRARVRRAQAARRRRRSAVRGCSAPRRWPSSPSRPCRSRCCGRSPSPSAGTRRRSWRFVLAVVLGTVAFAGLALCLAGIAEGPRHAGRRQRPLPRAAAPVRHGHPARRAPRRRCSALASALPSAALAEVVRGTLGDADGRRPGLGACSPSGPSPPRCSPPACSAGSESVRSTGRPVRRRRCVSRR